jgi:VanZ family protein
MKKIKTKLFVFLIWTLLIFTAIAWPVYSEPVDSGITIYDKLVHFILFGVFNVLFISLCESFLNYKKIKISYKKIYFVGFLISFIYILLGEYIQNFVPGRNVSFWDVVSALAGVFLFSYISLKNKF